VPTLLAHYHTLLAAVRDLSSLEETSSSHNLSASQAVTSLAQVRQSPRTVGFGVRVTIKSPHPERASRKQVGDVPTLLAHYHTLLAAVRDLSSLEETSSSHNLSASQAVTSLARVRQSPRTVGFGVRVTIKSPHPERASRKQVGDVPQLLAHYHTLLAAVRDLSSLTGQI